MTKDCFLEKLSSGSPDKPLVVINRNSQGSKVYIKANTGRGRNRSNWTMALHELLLYEFEHLRAASVTVRRWLFRDVAVGLFNDADMPFSAAYVSNLYQCKPIRDIISFVNDLILFVECYIDELHSN